MIEQFLSFGWPIKDFKTIKIMLLNSMRTQKYTFNFGTNSKKLLTENFPFREGKVSSNNTTIGILSLARRHKESKLGSTT